MVLKKLYDDISVKRLSLTSRIFLFLILLSILSKAEFFPFSNYQMYSAAMLPDQNFKYHQLKAVTLDDQEVPLINRSFGLFHSEQPLIESIGRNRLSGKNVNEILRGILSHVNRDQVRFKEMRLYQVNYDWEKHKSTVLNGLPPPENAKSYKLIGQALE